MKIPRPIKHLYQKITRGWSDDDLWSLDLTIARFAAPRLRELQKNPVGWPDQHFKTCEDWEDAIGKMARAFELIIEENDTYPAWWGEGTAPEYKEIEDGLDLFRQHFRDLWQ